MLPFTDFKLPEDLFGKSISAIITLSSYYIQHLVDVSSRHFAVAFDIPLYNTSIYFSKLYSSRSLSMTLGSLFYYFIAFVLGINLKTLSFSSLSSMLFIRMAIIITLNNPYIIAVDVYKVLNAEAFVLGFFQTTQFKIIPRYFFSRGVSIDFGRFLVFVIQLLLDMCLYKSPLTMIKIQFWICVIITFIAVGSWFFYLYYFKLVFPEAKTHSSIVSHHTKEEISQPPNKFECQNFKKYDYRIAPKARLKPICRFSQYSVGNLSLFLMFLTSSMIKNFLFPGVLPYSLLERDKCHRINMILPSMYLIAPVLIYLSYRNCKAFCMKWTWVKDLFWLFIVPHIFSLSYALYTIHNKEFLYTELSGSYKTVLLMTILLIFSFSFIESLALSQYQLVFKDAPESLIMYHYIVSTFYGFVFSKVSVGYNCARVEYEYCLTPFYPTYKKGPISSFAFWIRDVFKRAYNDVCGDFRLNIQDYI